MGGRGGSSGFGKTGNLSKLEARRTQLESKKKHLGNKLEKIYSAEKNSDAYYKTLKARQDVTSKISALNDKITKIKSKSPAQAPKKTFVNSFGEATKREITSSSYKRAQARLNREIDNRFKGR